MNKFLERIYGPLVVWVVAVLLIDIVSDIIKKRKAKMPEKKNILEVIKKGETAAPKTVIE